MVYVRRMLQLAISLAALSMVGAGLAEARVGGQTASSAAAGKAWSGYVVYTIDQTNLFGEEYRASVKELFDGTFNGLGAKLLPDGVALQNFSWQATLIDDSGAESCPRLIETGSGGGKSTAPANISISGKKPTFYFSDGNPNRDYLPTTYTLSGCDVDEKGAGAATGIVRFDIAAETPGLTLAATTLKGQQDLLPFNPSGYVAYHEGYQWQLTRCADANHDGLPDVSCTSAKPKGKHKPKAKS